MTSSVSPPAPTGEIVDALRAVLSPFADSAGAGDDVDQAILAVLTAEMLGQPRFGVAMVAKERGGAEAEERPAADRVSSTYPAVVSIDARGLPGVVALAQAARLAQERVEKFGAVVVGIRDVGATGVLGTVVRRLAAGGSIALLVAESGPFVAPWGGHTAVIGTNPLALAVPRHDAPPFVMDFATAPLTVAAVRDSAARHAPLPEGAALDADGEPTTDASAVAAILADSRIASLAGLAVQLLAGVATASTSGATGDPYAPRGLTLIAFRPPADDAVRTGDDLLRRWSDAGGHIPARLDSMPQRLEDLPPRLPLTEMTQDALRALRTN